MEATNTFPFAIEDIQEPNKIYDKKLVHVGPKRYLFPSGYKELGPQYYNFKLRSDDIFIVGLPRSGTTWSQEMIWLLNNNLDYDRAKATVLSERIPTIDLQLYGNIISLGENTSLPQEVLKRFESPLNWLPNAPSPRFIKSHLPLSLMPPGLLDTTKVVYVARDPRDVVVSLYNILKIYLLKDIPFEKYWDAFCEGNIIRAPLFEHIKEGWALKDHPNLFFMTYEEMSKDLPSIVRRMSTFFGKQYTEEQIRRLCEHLSFEKFKTNTAVNRDTTFSAAGITREKFSFVRKGKVRGWEECFSEELKGKANRWMADNLAGTDLPFSV
ncbi:luciferin sulfotransferase-like [Pieris napi]|uniref:luciferin sulfotransferase-like n=1 Tax=Pieris napi TaxID=78633 RepID=UPI001FB94E82|nr:luciferin sulfotransferase-like [Pieris napi]